MSPAACCSVVQPVEPVAGFAALVGVGEDQDRVRLHRVDDGTVIRSKAVRGYPYRIVYTVEPDTILILAYAHERREPGYWLHRLND